MNPCRPLLGTLAFIILSVAYGTEEMRGGPRVLTTRAALSLTAAPRGEEPSVRLIIGLAEH